jgi:hypothetical protein
MLSNVNKKLCITLLVRRNVGSTHHVSWYHDVLLLNRNLVIFKWRHYFKSLDISFSPELQSNVQEHVVRVPPASSVPVVAPSKGGYTLVTSPRTVTPCHDSVDGTCNHVTYQRWLRGNVMDMVGIWPLHQRDDTVTAWAGMDLQRDTSPPPVGRVHTYRLCSVNSPASNARG